MKYDERKMNDAENEQLLLSLIEGNPKDADIWFDDIEAKRIDIDSNFNWTLLVFQFTTNAHHAASLNDKEMSLAWAELAIKVYHFVSTLFSEGSISFSNECSEMYLRAGLINKFGIVEGHEILDIKIIVDWFFDNLEMTLEETQNHISKWDEMNQEEKLYFIKNTNILKQIRKIKNRLNVIYFLYENGILSLNNELKLWIELRGKLF